jgi:uncharacterized protein (UPF0332 family)
MMFDWSEYIKVAQDLLSIPQPSACCEAIVRSAVSRAYYASYCAAYQAVISHMPLVLNSTSSEGTHKILLNTIFSVKNQSWKAVGRTLDDLRQMRVAADYHAQVPSWGSNDVALRKKAEFAIGQATSLLSQLAVLPSPPP